MAIYKRIYLTKSSCYLSYITQGIVNNFVPLLFVFLNKNYNLPLTALAGVAVYNFIIQLIADLIFAFFVDKIGYKRIGIIAQSACVVGFVLLAFLPRYMNAIAGIFIASTFYCMGGGLIEIVATPVIVSLPSKHKGFEIGLTHGIYCFGSFLTILISFFYFLNAKIDSWWILSLIFASICALGLLLFIFSNCPSPMSKEEKRAIKEPFYKKKFFYILCLMMILAGASEIGMTQWISTYAEIGLNIQKPYGDLYGAGLFALAMGIARVIFGLISKKVDVRIILVCSGVLAISGYLLASLPNNPVVNLVGAFIVGIGVASFWPGTVTISEKYTPPNSNAYTFLAIFGDIGCGMGAYLVGLIASGLSLKYAILIATICPTIFAICSMWFVFKKRKNVKEECFKQ